MARNTYLANSFSIQMISEVDLANVTFVKVGPEMVPADAISCIGHADTAAVCSTILGRKIEANRVSITLNPGDVLYVAQLTGGRLPEGATTLPEGFKIEFYKVIVKSVYEKCIDCDGMVGPCRSNCTLLW
jgi:hypothetical protein